MQKPYTSVEIQNESRAGRAPYNFVPLAGEEWKRVKAPPEADHYDHKLLQGEIDVQWEAKSDFYTRGMWSLAEFRNKPEDKEQAEPFQAGAKLRLPGSSIRGMVRTLIEIMSFGPMDEVNETQMFFRTVASVPDPTNRRSFEPQAAAYKERLLENNELKVEAGYLYGSRGEWSIHPATRDADTKKQWYRYRTIESWTRRPVKFDVDDGGQFARLNERGAEEGWLVCSGKIPGKQKQWVVRGEDKDKEKWVRIDEDLVRAYKENGKTRDIERYHFEYDDQTNGMPCFFVMQGGAVLAFGHTPYMRMPYAKKVSEAIPNNQRRTDGEEWDLAQAMFGRIGNGQEVRGQRSRVFFEDGFVVEGGELSEVRKVVLGQPKPTTYQHYLVQPGENVNQVMHWDGNYKLEGRPVIRGHKLYWHRPVNQIQGRSEKDNVATEIRPAKAGAKFTARIRFENLKPEELGCLLTVLALPRGCAHKLGMGKPLGYGSFEVSRITVRVNDIEQRYGNLFASDGSLATGSRSLNAQQFSEYQNRFADWVLEGSGKTLSSLWSHPRLVELRALLSLYDLQQQPDWWERTRYLEFGKVGGRNYNEYQEVGWPNPVLEKRRPLPPASQVRRGGKGVPVSKRPEFGR